LLQLPAQTPVREENCRLHVVVYRPAVAEL